METARILARLETVMLDIRDGRGKWDEVVSLLTELRYLDADSRMAGAILGMLSPWLPTLRDTPAGTPQAVRQVSFGINGLDDILPLPGTLDRNDEYRWPTLEKSIEWIVDQNVAGRDALQSLHRDLRRRAFSESVIQNTRILEGLQDALAQSLVDGDSVDQFRERLTGKLALPKAEAETLLRTNTKQAYLYGQERALDQPRVKDRFRWVYYAATKDIRTRKHHAALDGWVAERGTPLHRVFLKVQSEFNCRCTVIPCDESRANRYGVKTEADLPADLRSFL